MRPVHTSWKGPGPKTAVQRQQHEHQLAGVHQAQSHLARSEKHQTQGEDQVLWQPVQQGPAGYAPAAYTAL